MKIVFDNIIFSIQKSGGISVVWYELLTRILRNKEFETKFIEYRNNKQNIFRKGIPIKSDQIITKKNSTNIARYINPLIQKQSEPFIFHSSYYRTTPNRNAINITTVHDFTYEKHRHGLRKHVHVFQKHRAIKNSDYIICVSENTKNDLLNIIPEIDSRKISVIYNGVSDDYFPVSTRSDVQLKFQRNKYVIFVGGRDNYKRFDIAVEIASKLNMNLAIVGGGILTKKETSLLNSRLDSKTYHHYDKLTNKELNILYNNALCLIYPSEYEGFGIPVIEAQKSGCPVVAFNGGSVKEISGNNPLLFDHYNINEIVRIIENNLYDFNIREHIVSEGIKNAENFSWEQTYTKTVNLYKMAFEMRTRTKSNS